MTSKTFIAISLLRRCTKKARVEFIKRGGRNPRTEDGVLDLLEEIQDVIEAEMQLKHANRRRNNNNFKNNDHTSTHDNDDHNKNTCRKKGHNHEWIDCPDNPNSKITSAGITASVETKKPGRILGRWRTAREAPSP